VNKAKYSLIQTRLFLVHFILCASRCLLLLVTACAMLAIRDLHMTAMILNVLKIN